MTLRSVNDVLRAFGYDPVPCVDEEGLYALKAELESMNCKNQVCEMIEVSGDKILRLVGMKYAGSPELAVLLLWCQERLHQLTAESN